MHTFGVRVHYARVDDLTIKPAIRRLEKRACNRHPDDV